MALVLRGVLASFILLAALPFGFPDSFKFPPGDFRNCPLLEGVLRFEVLPGAGWDNLRNQHMGLVFARNYSQCKLSEDGKFLIPDNTVIYPVKNSKVDTHAEIYENWSNFSSMTAKSINAEAAISFPFGSISGSYSEEFESVKRHQVEDNTATVLVQLRHNLYKVKLEPDTVLQPTFKSRLLEIGARLQQNNTEHVTFLAGLLVRDFGTHYVSSVNAGAVLAKMDHLQRKYLENFEGEKSAITAAASVSFFNIFDAVNLSAKFSYMHQTGQQNLDGYTNNVVHSTVYTIGGPPFRADFTIRQWEDQLLNNLVAIDRSGDPLYFAITPGSLPEMSEMLTFDVAEAVKNATLLYYENNKLSGCTKTDSPNFSFRANFDDGSSCESPTNNYTFGGVYQTCAIEYPASSANWHSRTAEFCEDFDQENPLTSDYSCPDGYESIPISEGVVFITHTCSDPYCQPCLFLLFRLLRLFQPSMNTCQRTCGVYVGYKTYWCAAIRGRVPANTGYLFGGLYSDELNNPVTRSRSCPPKFYALQFGEKMRVCVSDDYEHGFPRSVPFGGFSSCKHGNPLGAGNTKLDKYVEKPGPPDWPQTCPPGYSQHLGAIEHNPHTCEIRFCVKSNVFDMDGLPVIKRPPYTKPSKVYNYTIPMHIVNQDTGQVWFKPDHKSPHWVLAAESSVTEYATQNDKHKEDDKGLSKGGAVAVTFVVTVVVGLLAVIAWRNQNGVKKIFRKSESQVPLYNPSTTRDGYDTLPAERESSA